MPPLKQMIFRSQSISPISQTDASLETGGLYLNHLPSCPLLNGSTEAAIVPNYLMGNSVRRNFSSRIKVCPFFWWGTLHEHLHHVPSRTYVRDVKINKTNTLHNSSSSLFASNVGSEHFIGQSGDGARRGLAVAMFELYAAILILLLGWVFAPIYRRAGVYTTPEFLELRFNSACRLYLSVITCILYVLTKISASIYGGAVVLSLTLGWDLYWSAGGCIVLSSIYTICGGLRAVMYTDFVQTLVFVIGGLVVLYYSLDEVGGWAGVQERLVEQGKDDFWHLFKPASDEDYPWTGMLFGQSVGSIWYWCMVRRGTCESPSRDLCLTVCLC